MRDDGSNTMVTGEQKQPWRAAKDGETWELLVGDVWREYRYEKGGDGVPSMFLPVKYGTPIVPLYPEETATILDSRLVKSVAASNDGEQLRVTGSEASA